MLGKLDVPAAPDDRVQMAAWMPQITELVCTSLVVVTLHTEHRPQVRNGKIKTNPVKLWSGGLSAIPDGLEHLRQGKVSAEKIVYKLDA
jgi:hypothetical protein